MNKAFAFGAKRPFSINRMIYCCMLLKSDLPYKFRAAGCEDVDMSLQILTGGWCTLLFHIYAFDAPSTTTNAGGNTEIIYQGDGKLQIARELYRYWPNIVKITRKDGRPKFNVNHVWRKFDTPLKAKE